MATCVSMNCPFISYCKHYSLTKEHSDGCNVQTRILHAAKRLEAIEKRKGVGSKK